MKIVDANIVLRYLLNDHEELSEKAAAIIDQNEVMIPNEVVAEIVYVLQKVYGVKDNEICDTLLELFNGENIVVDNMEMMEEAMGAVPVGYEQIVLLDGVKYDIVWYGENAGYRFKTSPGFAIKELTWSEVETLDDVIQQLGNLNTDEIVRKMHEEEAYKCTDSNCLIPFSFAEKLTID